MKEASGNLQQIMEILRDKPSDFDVLSGDDGITQPMMALGAKGVISVAANGYPDVFCKMVTSMLKDEVGTALKLHYKMLQMNNLIFADGNPAGNFGRSGRDQSSRTGTASGTAGNGS